MTCNCIDHELSPGTCTVHPELLEIFRFGTRQPFAGFLLLVKVASGIK